MARRALGINPYADQTAKRLRQQHRQIEQDSKELLSLASKFIPEEEVLMFGEKHKAVRDEGRNVIVVPIKGKKEKKYSPRALEKVHK